MHKEIKGTDMQWLAEGWWDHYFKHRTISKAKITGISGAVILVAGIVLLVTGFATGGQVFDAAYDTPLPAWVIAILPIGVVLLITGGILCFKADSIECRERDKFVDYIIDQWEEGDRDLPDADTVAEYLKNRSLLE